jgi:2-amino-4-hydroxy-6-hydroxymethyldihydropteridine diphosphokinase
VSARFAVIGLGGNLGDPPRAFLSAAAMLEATEGVRVLARSRLYESAPVGPPQPNYSNAALRLEIEVGARALLERCLEIERAHGRDRAREQRWGPRTLDLDVLYVEGEEIDEDDLVVPHPRLEERAFAIVPLLDVAPELEERYRLASGLRKGDLHEVAWPLTGDLSPMMPPAG